MNFILDFLTKLSGSELVALASIISIFLSDSLSSEELTILAIFVTTIGDNIAIIASSRANSSNISSTFENSQLQ